MAKVDITLQSIWRWLRPPDFPSAERRRAAATLHVISLAIGGLALFVGLFTLALIPNPAFILTMVGTAILVCGATSVLMRCGYVELASRLFAAVLWVIMVCTALFTGGLHSVAFGSLIIVVLVVLLLCGGRAAIISAALSTLVGLVLLQLQLQQRLPASLLATEAQAEFTWAGYTADFILGACIVWLTMRGFDQALQQARAAEAALAIERNLLRMVIDHLPDYIYLKDCDHRIVLSNRANAAALGKADPAEVLGKTLFDFYSPEAAEPYHLLDRTVLTTEQPIVNRENGFVNLLNGEQKWSLMTRLPFRDVQGALVGVLGISRDITERKQAEQRIQHMNAELEQRVAERTRALAAANEELEAFAYSVSHDLRAPLRAIDGYTRILLEDFAPLLDDEGRRICRVVCDEARRMGALIDDLLAFSRLGRVDLRLAPVPVEALVQSVFAEIITAAAAQRVQFRASGLPDAIGDYTLLHQVWINLLANALKFSAKRDLICIDVEGWQSANEIVYLVRDNGAGFEMQYVHKLFGVFQRLHSEREFPGTGVGLAIVQRIVQRHGGRVWAEGAPDQGATFYFTLPRATTNERA